MSELFISKCFSTYLTWYEVMPLFLIDKGINNAILHPFIAQARKYYKLKDGLLLSLEGTKKMLAKTKKYLGTELVETAILANLPALECLSSIEYNAINHILNNSNKLPDYLEIVDKEICKAIEWSRCALYHFFLDTNSSNTLSLADIRFNYEHEYLAKAQNGILLTRDYQINQIATKTNMPIGYRYIFLNRFLTQRLRHQM